jgi:zinc protease
VSVAALAGLTFPLPASFAADERKPQTPELAVERYTLPNGLEVILHEDRTTPVVGVNIWYKVGSKNEKLGRTGFAHLFEHLMFQGSQHHDDEYITPIEKIGAQINGSTNEDRTNYYETVPSNALELALWLESDRMGFLLPALDQKKLDNQRDVVKNERRQRVDNQPYGQADEKILEALYPPDHPYHHSVIGSMADLSAASLSDVSAFFRTYYSPNNASLCLAGDFDPAEAKRLIAKYFGSFPRGPEVAKIAPRVAKLDAPKHLKMTDQVQLPLAQLIWPTVPTADPDEPALDVLAEVLGGLKKENRLYRALMYDRQLAAQVQAGHPTQPLSGKFEVGILARPGQKLDDLVKLADAEIERLKNEGPSEDEVLKAQNDRESALIIALESVTRQADFLNQYSVTYGDPLAYKAELARLFAVTPADVKRVANKYLTANRLRFDVNPGPPTPRAPEVAVDRAKQEPLVVPKAGEIKDEFDRSTMPKTGPTPKFTPPDVIRRKLSNGLEVLVAERHNLPILTVHLVVKGGETLVDKRLNGLASLTASYLTEGTKTRDSLRLASDLNMLGANLSASGELESSSVTLTTLTKHRDKALELFSDVVVNPSFPQKELRRLVAQRMSMLQFQLDTPDGIAANVYPRLLYGADHPYGRTAAGTLSSIPSIRRDDAVGLHGKLYVPNNSALIVVGDTTADAITSALESALKDWKPGTVPTHKLPEPPPPKPTAVYLVNKPAAAQSILSVGFVGPARSTPDYFPLTVLNAILGGQFSSRLNLNLREDKGYSYGASSHFYFHKGPGPFEAECSVQTDVTKPALGEMLKELTEIVGKRPATDAETAFAKERTIMGFPSRFSTTAGVAATLDALVVYDLPADYFTTYRSKVEAVTTAEVNEVARRHILADKLTVLVVGDRAKVEPELKSLPIGKEIHLRDAMGNPVSAESGTSSGGR